MKIRKNVVAWIGMVMCTVLVVFAFVIEVISNWFAILPGVLFIVFLVQFIKECRKTKSSKSSKKIRWALVISIILNALLTIATILVAIFFGWLFLLPLVALCILGIWLMCLLKKEFAWIPVVALIVAVILLGNYGITGTLMKDFNLAIKTLTVDNLVVKNDITVEQGNVNLNEGDINIDKGDVNVNEGDINVDKGDVNVNEGDINVDKGDVNVNEGDINVDKGDVNVNEGDINVDKGDVNVGGDINVEGDINTDVDNKPEEPKHEHSYSVEKVEPTCTEKGFSIYTCCCGDTYTDDEVAPLGHDYKDTIVTPTTEEQGYTLHTCERCGNSYKDNYTDKLPQPKNPTISVSTDYMVKGDTVIVTLKDADESNVVIKYVDPNTGDWVKNGASLKSIGDGQYRLMIDDSLWTMAVDLTLGLDSNNNYHIVTLEPCYE